MPQMGTLEVLDRRSGERGRTYDEQALIEEARFFQRRRRRRGWIVLAAAAALVAILSMIVGIGRSDAKRPVTHADLTSLGGSHSCSLADLSFRAPVKRGAAGTSYVTVPFVNRGISCRLAPIDARPFNTLTHQYVGPAALIYGNMYSTLTAYEFAHQRLRHSAAARFVIGFRTAVDFPPATCRLATANALYLFLRGAPQDRVLVSTANGDWNEQVCTRFASLFTLGPWLGK